MKKKLLAICLLIVLVLALGLVAFSLCTAKGEPPELLEVKDRLVYLIESSKEMNTLFFGKGLPVFKRGSEISDRLTVYGYNEVLYYDVLMGQSDHLSVSDIKEDAEMIYSTEYLNAMYETAFDGVVYASGSAYVRFYDNGNALYQNSNATDFGIYERVYDYSTLEIVEPSDSEYLNVTVKTYSLKDGSESTVNLSFVKEGDAWYLNSPTY